MSDHSPLTRDEQNYLATDITVKLLNYLEQRGLELGIIADTLMNVGVAAALRDRGVNLTLADLRRVTADIDRERDKFVDVSSH